MSQELTDAEQLRQVADDLKWMRVAGFDTILRSIADRLERPGVDAWAVRDGDGLYCIGTNEADVRRSFDLSAMSVFGGRGELVSMKIHSVTPAAT